MDSLAHFVSTLNDWVWGLPMLVAIYLLALAVFAFTQLTTERQQRLALLAGRQAEGGDRLA